MEMEDLKIIKPGRRGTWANIARLHKGGFSIGAGFCDKNETLKDERVFIGIPSNTNGICYLLFAEKGYKLKINGFGLQLSIPVGKMPSEEKMPRGKYSIEKYENGDKKGLKLTHIDNK